MAELIGSASLDQTVNSVLELDQHDMSAFDGRQLDALGLDDQIGDLALEDIAAHSSYGLRPKEETSDQNMLRIAVFGLRRWLDRQVLQAQNVFVDLPHLLQRQPWLAADRDELEAWNNSAPWWGVADTTSPPGFATVPSRWLGRPVWKLASLLAEPPRGPRFLPSDPVFCEDISEFVLADAARDFVTDLPSSSPQRFVANIDGVDYHPRRRLLA